MTPSCLLPGEGLLAQLVPAVVEFALVLVSPFLRHMMGRMRRARREIGEEGLVRHQRLLLADPVDRLGGHVIGQMIALFGGFLRLNRRGAFVQRRVVLVRLAADKPVEVLESPAAAGPCVERTHGAGLPDRHFMALAELRGRIAVELEGARKRGAGVRQNRVVARRRGRNFRDAAHTHRMMVAAGQHRLTGRRAERRRVEPGEPEPVGAKLLEVRGMARTAEGAGSAVADVVDEHDEDIRRALWRAQLPDRWILRVGVLGVVGRQADVRLIRDREEQFAESYLARPSDRPPSLRCSDFPSPSPGSELLRHATQQVVRAPPSYKCGTRKLREAVSDPRLPSSQFEWSRCLKSLRSTLKTNARSGRSLRRRLPPPPGRACARPGAGSYGGGSRRGVTLNFNG